MKKFFISVHANVIHPGETSYLLTFSNEQAMPEVQAFNNGSCSVIKKVKRNS